MEKISLDTLEMGNLLFGHSRGKYAIDREEWQVLFCNFLERCGFDSYGHAVEDSLEDFIKTDFGIGRFFSSTKLSAEYIKENGTRVEDREGLPAYSLNDKLYVIKECPEDKYDEDYDKWCKEYFSCEDDEKTAELLKQEPDFNNYKKIEKVFSLKEKEEHQHYFDNGIFQVRPYYWGEDTQIMEKPNFIFYPKVFEMSWYKYPLRDSYCSKNITTEEFKQILQDCEKSLRVKFNKVK